MTISFTINNQPVSIDVEPDMPLLWVLRDELGLTGTKFGCGIAACGACTVQINGAPVRTCVLPVQAAAGAEIITIEGLGRLRLHPVQEAWIKHQVPQCGYCQSGMIMTLSALLDKNPSATETELENALTNVCRCGTYQRMRDAISDLRDK